MCVGPGWSCWLLSWRTRESRSRVSFWSAPWVSRSSLHIWSNLFYNVRVLFTLSFISRRHLLAPEQLKIHSKRWVSFLLQPVINSWLYLCFYSQVFPDWWTYWQTLEKSFATMWVPVPAVTFRPTLFVCEKTQPTHSFQWGQSVGQQKVVPGCNDT